MEDKPSLTIDKLELETPFIAQGRRFHALEGDLRGVGGLILSGFVPARKYEAPGQGSIPKRLDDSVVGVHRRFLSQNQIKDLPVLVGITHPGSNSPLGVKREVPSVIESENGRCAREMKRIKTWDCEMLSILMGRSALAAREAGYQGIVLEAQKGSLIGEMMRKERNFRRDKFGGNFVNRLRLACACIEEMKGSGLPVLVKISLEDMDKKEVLLQILLLKQAGMDGLIIDSGDETLAQRIKSLSDLPVLLTRRTSFLAGAALSVTGKGSDGLVFEA